ncbi:SWIM zinc finger family protein [Microbacterium sp.]|uniref:SWIM zinc finger family protein n=1 Tax=Microbacterium sp. TaxID=51671 RepID=UPI00333EA15F
MGQSSIEYDYAGASSLAAGSEGARLSLATSGGSDASGAVSHPYFFSGFAEHPGVVAAGLLMLARVARTRFYVPPNTLAAVLRAADPVVTSSPDGLRFESFSVCCGVYARLDVDAVALDTAYAASGVTNVDVNPPLRQALAGLRPSEPLHLGVGDDELRVSTFDHEIVEERVPLPARWLKGFGETQTLSAGMTLRHELTGPAVRQFVQGLPRSSATKTVMWATQAARTLRLASRPSRGAVCVAGPERLRVLEPLLRFATSLRAYGPDADASSLPAPSAWVLELPGARVTVGLSPEKARGFSGEGAVLHALAGADGAGDADLLGALLAFEPRIDIPLLSQTAGLSESRVRGGLAALASQGLVGYDLHTGAFFHRPLPVRPELLGMLHPRLADARMLADAGSVRRGADGRFVVDSGGTPYEVALAADPVDDRCTCPWRAKHRGTRGPCKHVLAARLVAGDRERG